tara:strand:+ start:214 stop:399 length:186 start_codon:yes stop_codon:yes gene_type:complete
MTRIIDDQNDPDKIIEAIEAMVNTWTLEELMDFVIEDRAEYYLGKNVSKAEVEQLLNEYTL